MMRRVVGGLVVFAAIGTLSSCSDQASSDQAAADPAPLSSAASIDTGPTTSVALAPTTRGDTPTTTVTPTTAVAVDASVGNRSIQHAAGVVIAVDGDLSEIRAFTMLLADGTALDLVPQAGLLFDGGPLAHLRDHLVSGAPISVDYHGEGGVALATSVGDAE